MKPYLVSLGAGLFVGAIYALLGVRSPAPPVIALMGILLGEQAAPIAKRLLTKAPVVSYLRTLNARVSSSARRPRSPESRRPDARGGRRGGRGAARSR